MSQNISVHSTDDSGTNIIPGIDDGGAGVGNGSTYQIYRNDAPTGDSGRVYYAKDKDGNTETISGGGSTIDPVFGQAYSKTSQSIIAGNAVTWDAIQNTTGVTLNSPTTIRVSKVGTYQVEWVVEFKTVYTPS